MPPRIAVQLALAPLVCQRDLIPEAPRFVAGVDISGSRDTGEALGAVVVLSYPGLELVEVQTARKTPLMPYIPGLLSLSRDPGAHGGFRAAARHA